MNKTKTKKKILMNSQGKTVFIIIKIILRSLLLFISVNILFLRDYTPRKRSLGGGGYIGITPSVCLSVRLSVCPE